jgi:4-amino-4-deoxychorismate lyase
MPEPGACLVDGKETRLLPVSDRGFQYGDGLFETIAWIDGLAPLLDRHMRRLALGCERLALDLPERTLLESEIHRVAADSSRAIIKLIVSRSGGERGYRIDANAGSRRVVLSSPWPERPAHWYREGVAVRVCSTRLSSQPLLAGLKTLARLDQVLARAEWDGDEFYDGIMLQAEGTVVCGTMSNVFLVRNSVLLTPDLSRCGVAGVMRATVMDIAREAGLRVECRDVHLEELQDCDELLLTNAVSGILPVNRIDTRVMPVGPLTRRLQSLVDARFRLR